jgi:CheY-like chemotaxis protein
MKIDVEKIIKQSKGLKSYKKFNVESKNIRKLLDKFMKSKDLEFNEIFAEWIIIRLVIIWEYHFKSLISSLIDDGHYKYDEEIKLSLIDLEKIQKKKSVSAGKIFVSTKSLQNIKIVDAIMSNLLNISFLKDLKVTYPEYINIKIIEECLEKRHQIVHEMKKFTFTKKQIERYATFMMLFQIQSSEFCNKITEKGSVDKRKNPTIMIVDDEQRLNDIIEEVFIRNTEYEIVSKATDGKMAVEEYRKKLPDIVLLDVMMPKFDGMYALEHIKKINKDAKVIMITGDINPKTKAMALKLDASAVLYKPTEVGILLATVKKILTKKQPMIVEKQRISKKLREQMIQENVRVWNNE